MEKNNKVSGVYSVIVESYVYVGNSTDIDKRYSEHTSKLRHGKHHCKALQKAYNESGFDLINFNILEMCDVEKLDQREQYWIDWYVKTGIYEVCNKNKGSKPVFDRNYITELDVVKIKQMNKQGVKNKDIAVEFGINHSTVSNIIRGFRWKDVG